MISFKLACIVFPILVLRCRCYFTPGITSFPTSNFMIQQGGTIQVMCNASGDPEPVVHWVRLDSSLSATATDSNGLLSIPNFSSSDNGIYVCVAVNSVGMDVSNITTLATTTVSFGINSVEVDNYHVLNQDDTARLPCCTSDSIPRENFWIRQDSVQISADAAGLMLPNLVIPMFSSNDEAIYFCLSGDQQSVSAYGLKVTILTTCEYSSIFDIEQANSLTSISKEKFYNSEEVQGIANNGDWIRFECCSEDRYLNHTIKWIRLDGQNISDNIHYITETNDIIFHDLDLSYFTIYVCIIYTEEGNFWTSQSFNGSGAAFDSPDLADTFVESMLGHTVLIDCCIDGKLTDFGWYRNGRKIYEGDDDVSGVRSKYLVLRNVSEEDVGLYTCVSLISEQEFLHQTYLNFTMIIECLIVPATFSIGNGVPYSYQVPEITSISPSNVNITVQEGSSVDLNCTASGIPTPFITWVRLDSSLSSAASNANGTLSISSFNSTTDAGTYVCVAVNDVGMDVSNITTLTTGNVTSFLEPNYDDIKEVNQNDTTLLSCCVSDATPTEKYWIRHQSKTVSDDASGLTMPYLVLSATTSHDEGIYFCLSGNTQSVSRYTWKVRILSYCLYSASSTGNSSLLDDVYSIAIQSSVPILPGDFVNILCNTSISYTRVDWVKIDGVSGIPGSSMIVNNLTFIVPSINETDFGFYTCLIFSDSDKFSAPEPLLIGSGYQLDLRSAAEFANETMIVNANHTILIDCCAEGAVSSYKWYRNGTDITPGSSQLRILVIPNIQEQDIGLYTCIVGKNFQPVFYHVLVLFEALTDSFVSSSSIIPVSEDLTPSVIVQSSALSSLIMTSSPAASQEIYTSIVSSTEEMLYITLRLSQSSSIMWSSLIHHNPTPTPIPTSRTTQLPPGPPQFPSDGIDGMINVNTGSNDETPIVNTALPVTATTIGSLFISTIGVFSISYVCCKRGLFGNSQLDRVLKSEEHRLWDIVKGIEKQTLLSQAIRIIDRMDTEGNSDFITIEHGQESRGGDGLASVQINWGGSSNNAIWQHDDDVISDYSRYSNRGLEEQSSVISDYSRFSNRGLEEQSSVISDYSRYSNRGLEEQSSSDDFHSVMSMVVSQSDSVNVNENEFSSLQQNAPSNLDEIKIQSESNAEATPAATTDSTYSKVETVPAKSNVDQAPTHVDNISVTGLSLVSEVTSTDDSFHSFELM